MAAKRSNRRKDAPVSLAAVLDLNAAGPLAEQLRARRGAPLALDGSVVERLGGQCLQVLLAAQKTWAADGQPFRLATPSSSLAEALATFGVPDFGQDIVAETRT